MFRGSMTIQYENQTYEVLGYKTPKKGDIFIDIDSEGNPFVAMADIDINLPETDSCDLFYAFTLKHKF